MNQSLSQNNINMNPTTPLPSVGTPSRPKANWQVAGVALAVVTVILGATLGIFAVSNSSAMAKKDKQIKELSEKIAKLPKGEVGGQEREGSIDKGQPREGNCEHDLAEKAGDLKIHELVKSIKEQNEVVRGMELYEGDNKWVLAKLEVMGVAMTKDAQGNDLTTFSGGAMGVYYKVRGDGAWKKAFLGQAVPLCKELSAEAREALRSVQDKLMMTTCFNDGTGQNEAI